VTYGLPFTPSFFNDSNPRQQLYHRIVYWLFALMPWNPLVKAILDMAAATNTDVHPGIRWSERDSYCLQSPAAAKGGYDPLVTWRDTACVFPIGSCLLSLAAQFVGYTVLAVWLDNVLPNALGVSRHPLFFLHRAFWRPRPAEQGEALARLVAEGERRSAAAKTALKKGHLSARLSTTGGLDEDEDVGEESNRIKHSLGQKLSNHALRGEDSDWLGLKKGGRGGGAANGHAHGAAGGGSGTSSAVRAAHRRSSAGGAPSSSAHFQWQPSQRHGDPDYAVEVFGLQKVFRLGWWTKNLPPWLGGNPAGKDFWAIKDSWFGIEQGSLFCLLGPNGAGKTTTINCLTGAVPRAPGGR
jgi:hypothetical protein